jgi:3-isopropylmalate/(R)-2-methylmalate dehydratase large subunit
MQKTLFEKIWEAHEVSSLSEVQSLLYIDRIFLHERTGAIALQSLAEKQRQVRQRAHAFCTMDHIVDTIPGRSDHTLMPSGREFIIATRSATQDADIRLFDINDPDQGIVHVLSPELGIALPGSTIICPDSHTCTLGGVGAVGWGVGSTEAEHALATSTLRVKRPRTMRINYTGEAPANLTAKDIILLTIRTLGTGGGSGFAIEFSGDAIRKLEVEARLTICNMSVELSAFTGIIEPDPQVMDWFSGRDFAPTGEQLDLAKSYWQSLKTDTLATFDRETTIDLSQAKPQLSWGTSPEHCIDHDGKIPEPKDAPSKIAREAWRRALEYMELKPSTHLSNYPIQAAFIGSCTNSRLSDLRAAADYLQQTNNKVAKGVKAICVPGSGRVKRAAEAEGLDKIFIEAGFEWREPGCSLCFYAGGEDFGEGARIVSTTNRNFEGRQGIRAKTHLASPISVAASACAGFPIGGLL